MAAAMASVGGDGGDRVPRRGPDDAEQGGHVQRDEPLRLPRLLQRPRLPPPLPSLLPPQGEETSPYLLGALQVLLPGSRWDNCDAELCIRWS